MRWTTPATNNSPLTRYDTERCFDYALQPCPIEGEFAGNTTQVKHDFGSRNIWDVNFWIRIRAVNLIGAGPWSDKVYFNAPTVNIPDQTWVEDIAVSVTLPAATNGVAPADVFAGRNASHRGELQHLHPGPVGHPLGRDERRHLHLQDRRCQQPLFQGRIHDCGSRGHRPAIPDVWRTCRTKSGCKMRQRR